MMTSAMDHRMQISFISHRLAADLQIAFNVSSGAVEHPDKHEADGERARPD